MYSFNLCHWNFFLTLFPQPTFPVRVEECVHKVVAIILRDLERLSLNTVVETLENKINTNQKQAVT